MIMPHTNEELLLFSGELFYRLSTNTASSGYYYCFAVNIYTNMYVWG